MAAPSVSIISKAREYIDTLFEIKIDKVYTYHSHEHTIRVYESAKQLAEMANISTDAKDLLLIAALFHDTGFVQGPVDHELRSQELADAFLSTHGYDESDISKVKEYIAATKMDTETDDYIAQLLQDADLSGLAADNYSEITESLRKELNNTTDRHITKKKWRKENINFYNHCRYKTKEGQTLYQQKKMENLRELERLSEADKSSTKKSKGVKSISISSNKSAQTQFKTALRNHIDLSNIADNKANIMISVNALILTVALPFLIDKAIDNYRFWIPAALLGIVCLISMVYATLSTRPISMKGLTSKEKIQNNQSNLFFFGNYYKMSFDDYKEGINTVLEKEEYLDNSIIRDLYFLGKSLGGKFHNLRLCYNIFMYGIVAVVLSLAIVFAI